MSRHLDDDDEGALNNPFFEPEAEQHGRGGGASDLFSFDIHGSWNSLRSEMSSRLPTNLYQFRDLPTVFGTDENSPFNFPPVGVFLVRIKNNAQYFALNYGALLLLIAGASIITNALAFFVLLVLAGGWLFARSLILKLQQPRHSNIELPVIGVLTSRHVLYAMAVVSAFCGAYLMWSLMFTWIFWASLVFVVAHMVTREHRNVRSRQEAPAVSPDMLESGTGARSRKTIQ